MACGDSNSDLEKLLEQLNVFTKEPERFLAEQPQLATKVKTHTKSLYDALKNNEPPDHHKDALPELIIENFDDEQIWQEIELQNTPSVSSFISSVSKILAAKDRLTFEESKDESSGEEEMDDLDQAANELSEDDEDDVKSDSDIDILDDDLSGLHPRDSDDSDADLERLLDIAEAARNPEDMEDESDDDLEEEELVPKKSTAYIKSKKSVVDDQFFRLSEMEEFLTQEDLREERRMAGKDESEDEEDYDEDNKEGMDAMYAEYFGGGGDASSTKQKKKKRVTFENEEADDDESNDEEENDAGEEQTVRKKNLLDSDSEGEDADDVLGRKTKSTFEERQERMQKKIAALEAASLADKSWQLSGEVGGAVRPENSLLQEDLDFDHTSKLPPVITEETTMKLDDLIKQRIKDKAWDDVERKVKTKEDPFEYKKRITLSQEKSKQSLSEIYAQEYMKQTESEDKEKERDPKHAEIQKMMRTLFVKLDALSNFHYTPKPAVPDVRIVTNMPTIAMEEVAPVSVGDGQLLAPEEIKAKKRGVEIGKTERTETDRLRERRQKKAEKRKRQKEKEKRQKLVEKTNPGLGNKYSKEKAMKQLEKDAKTTSGVTVIKEKSSSNKKNISSQQFFHQLQDEVTTQVRAKKANEKKKKEQARSSKNFML